MPLADAKAWLRNMLGLAKEGGTWYIPRSQTTYRVYHSRKTLVRIGPGDESTEYVAKELGWKIEEKQ